MNDTELNTLRKQLWANGYFPTPNLSKKCVLKGWNAKDFYTKELKRYGGDADAMLDSWSARHKNYRATGVRMERGLGGIDGDVDDEGLMGLLVGIIRRVVPEVEASAPLRYGSGTHKATWFVHVLGEQFTTIASRDYARSQDEIDAWLAAVDAWRAAGSAGDPPQEPDYHHVEIFGDAPAKNGNCHRQCGVFGWNAEPGNKAGKPVATYSWADVSLADVRLTELPQLTKAQAYEIVKQFEAAAEADGWVARPPQAEGAGAGDFFDIDRKKTVFSTAAYGEVRYAELEALVQAHGSVRLSANWIPGVISASDDRCNAQWSPRYGCVRVHEFGAAANHFPSDIPHGGLEDIADKMEQVRVRALATPAAPDAGGAKDQTARDGAASAPPEPPQGGGGGGGGGGGTASSGDGLLTQDLAALVFAEQTADDMRYCHDTGGWFAWAGSHWQQDRTRMAFHLAREISRQLSKRERDRKSIKAMRSAGFFSAVERIAETDPRLAVTSAHWDVDPYLMGTPDGTLDLRTGALRAADAADGISKLAALSPRQGVATPVWDRFLAQTFRGDEELIRFNQLWFGYGMTGDIREHALWFGYGSGGNGKGVLLNTISWLMGDYARAAPMDMFTAKTFDGHPTDLAMLRGARMVTASETEEGRAWAESRIKQLTGGDPVTARFMRENFFTYQPAFKLSLIGNHKPRLKNVDDAARRRFNLVPFLNRVAKEDQDKQLEVRLRAEGAGIMQWLVEGCLAWQRGGLAQSAAVRAATEQYFAEQDLVGQWLGEFCEAKVGATTATADLFRSWALYAQAAGVEPGVQRSLTDALERRGFEAARTNAHGRCFRGIRIAPTPRPDGTKPDLKAV